MPYNQFAAVGEETTWGTPVTRTHFMKVNEGSTLNQRSDRAVSAKLSANIGADPETVFDQGQRGEGRLVIPASFDDRGFLKVLKHGLGLLATSGAGPFTHTFTRKVGPPFAAGAVSTAQGLSVELNYELPDAGPLEARLLEGAMVKAMTFNWNAGEEITLDTEFIGERVTQVIKTGSPTFPDYAQYEMKFAQVTVSIDGTAYGSVISGLSFTLDNGYEPRIRLGNVNTQRPVRRGKATITGTLRLDWESSPAAKALWDKFVSNTASAIIVTITGPTNYSMVVTLNNVQWTGGDLLPEEGQLQSTEMPFQVLHDATNTAVKVVVSNQTSSI